jgi:hypothetical protein
MLLVAAGLAVSFIGQQYANANALDFPSSRPVKDRDDPSRIYLRGTNTPRIRHLYCLNPK